MDVLEEIKKYWKESPFWAKVVWAISAFLSFSAIASLSDTVFAWKGFILGGLIFYRELITPIKELISSIFNVNISNTQADVIVFLGIFISAYRKFVTNRWLVSKPSKKITTLFILINVLLWLLTMSFVVASILGKLYLVIDIVVIFYLISLVSGKTKNGHFHMCKCMILLGQECSMCFKSVTLVKYDLHCVLRGKIDYATIFTGH